MAPRQIHDVRKRRPLSPDRRQRLDDIKRAMRLQIALAELHEMLGVTSLGSGGAVDLMGGGFALGAGAHDRRRGADRRVLPIEVTAAEALLGDLRPRRVGWRALAARRMLVSWLRRSSNSTATSSGS
jgi:hypothetical protein